MDQPASVAVDRVSTEYLSTADAAKLTGFSQQALEIMRCRREGPPWIKIGRSVRYPLADLRDWLESGRVER